MQESIEASFLRTRLEEIGRERKSIGGGYWALSRGLLPIRSQSYPLAHRLHPFELYEEKGFVGVED